jgi:anti-sigma factor RsiW
MNLSPSQRFDLERLISIQLDGEPTDDEVLRLENLLRGDAECRRHYLRFVDLHAQLLQHPGLALLSPPPSGPPVAGSSMAGT